MLVECKGNCDECEHSTCLEENTISPAEKAAREQMVKNIEKMKNDSIKSSRYFRIGAILFVAFWIGLMLFTIIDKIKLLEPIPVTCECICPPSL